jgi:hypothetical protein
MRLLFFSSSVARPPTHTLPAMIAPVERPTSLWPAHAPPNARQMYDDRNRLDLQQQQNGMSRVMRRSAQAQGKAAHHAHDPSSPLQQQAVL